MTTVLPLGEVISWQCQATSFVAMTKALDGAGIDRSIARELTKRHAFSRAIRKMSEDRVIRLVKEDPHSMFFQFTKERKDGDKFVYDDHTMLTLDKDGGGISCTDPKLKAEADHELDVAIGMRTASDVTIIVQAFIERHGDLFPIRKQGGCYFVPQASVGVVDKIKVFLDGISGRLERFRCSAEDKETKRSIQETMEAGLNEVIAQYDAAILDFDKDTRASTIEKVTSRIRETRFKVEAYAALLGERKAFLDKKLTDSANHLRSKVKSIGKVEESPVLSAKKISGKLATTTARTLHSGLVGMSVEELLK